MFNIIILIEECHMSKKIKLLTFGNNSKKIRVSTFGKRKYTYNEFYSAVNKISEAVNMASKGSPEELFKDFVIFITFIRYMEKVINYLRADTKSKEFVNNDLFTLIENVYKVNGFNSNTPSIDILNKILCKIHPIEDYFNKIKKYLFPSDIQLNLNELELELNYIILTQEDLYNDSETRKSLSFIELSKNIEILLRVGDIDELINMFMVIHHSNKNKFHIASLFHKIILKILLSEYVKSEQNLVCLGTNPHVLYLGYRNSLRARKKLNFNFDIDKENVKIYFEEQSDVYNTLYPILLNLQSKLPRINILTDEVKDTSKETLVLTINNMENANDVTLFKYYYETLKHATKKAFMLAPYSMVSNHFLGNTEMFDRYKFMIDNRKIEKIYLFPNGYFTHTVETQVLLEISTEPVEGIHFIDLNLLFHHGVGYGKEPLIDAGHLKSISQWYKHEDLAVNFNKDISTLVRISKWVSYSDIIKIHNYNISPNYHLIKLIEVSNTSLLSDYFDIKKLQRFNFFGGYTILRVFTTSDFKEFGFTGSKDTHKEIRIEAPIPTALVGDYEKLKGEDLNEEERKLVKKYNKFKKSHQLQQYDILIYVNDPSHITVVGTVNPYTIASHNLIRLRVNQDKRSKIEELSKTLYLFLLSENGQKSLQKILIKDKRGKDILPIDTLKNIKVDLQNLPKQVKKFDKLQKQQEEIDTIRASIKEEFK